MLGQAQSFLVRMRETVAAAAALFLLASYLAPTMNLKSLMFPSKPIDTLNSFLSILSPKKSCGQSNADARQ